MIDDESLGPPVTSRYKEREEWRALLLRRVLVEVDRAYAKHGAEQWNRHEFLGILREEYKELEQAIFSDEPQSRVEEELVQVAAMCLRYFETRDRSREPSGA